MQDFTSVDLESLGVAKPYSMEAEQSVLGAALLESESVLPELVEALRPEMFYVRQNGEIFSEMVRLFTAGERVDLVTLLDAVVAAGVFESPDAAKVYLARLGETVPSISNVGAYARIVQEKFVSRQVLEVAQSILQQSGEAPSAELLLENAEQKLYEIRSGREQNSLTKLSAALVETLGTLQKITGPDKSKYAGIPTGFTYLDTILTGLGRSDLVILAARPGMGKTSFALNIATNVAKKQRVPVAIFSLEMSKEQLTNRILSAEAGVDSHAFRSGALGDAEWDDLAHASEILHDVPIYMDDTSGITIPEVKAKIRRVNQDPSRPPIGLVVIDYLQLMQSAGGKSRSGENRQQIVSDISRSLKIMAKELNVPVLCLSQLSRANESRTDKRPMLSDLRESGAIEQDADIVLFLYREGYYNRDAENPNLAECIIAKNRHGETGTVELQWQPEFTTFNDMEWQHGEG